MLVGFLVEGWDYLILQAYLARLLDRSEGDFEPDAVGGAGSNWQFVLESVPDALRRFYGRCAQFVVIGVDNDGSENARAAKPQDDGHPRHWLHPAPAAEVAAICRWCRLAELVAAIRPDLTWLPKKPGANWPVLIAVPVEAIEAWLLVTQAIVDPGHGSLYAENEDRRHFKQRLYGRPATTRRDVEEIALPMIRGMSTGDLIQLSNTSQSFRLFSDQVTAYRAQIIGKTDCW